MHVGNPGLGKHVPEYSTVGGAHASPRRAWYHVKAVAPPPPPAALPPALPPPSPPPLPAACTECTSTLQLALAGSLPQKLAYKLSRAASGILRIDYAVTSVIINPATLQMILLDHLKKEVRTIALPPPPPLALPQLQIPGLPPIPAAAAPALIAIDLGIRLIAGQQVQGMPYTLPPLTPPPPPQIQLPGMPPLPPIPVPKPLAAEIWLSTQLLLPVLTRITGAFGQQMCHCVNAVAGEPPPSTFQIPPDYKPVGLPPAPAPPAPPPAPQAPSMPSVAQAPSMPSAPQAPSMPSATQAPSMPSAPQAPSMPSVAQAPSMPSAPQAPSMPSAPKPPSLP